MKTNTPNTDTIFATGLSSTGKLTNNIEIPPFFDINESEAKDRIRYIKKKNNSSTVLFDEKVSRHHMLKSALVINDLLLMCSDNKENLFSSRARYTLNSIIELHFLRQFNITEYKKLIKKLPKDHIGRYFFEKKDEEMIENCFYARIFLYMFDRETENENTLEIYDYDVDENLNKELAEDWKKQPFTKRLGIKSKKEFLKEMTENSTGTIRANWINEEQLAVH